MLKFFKSILQQFLNEAFCCDEAFLQQQRHFFFALLREMSSGFNFAKNKSESNTH